MSEVISEWQKRHGKWPDWIDFFFDFYLSNYTVTLYLCPKALTPASKLQATYRVRSCSIVRADHGVCMC